MPFVTTLVLSLFAGYTAGWYLGWIEGSFPLLLLLATVVTGIYWAAERWYFLPRRQMAAQALEGSFAHRQEALARMGIDPEEKDLAQAQKKLLAQPWWLDWTAGLFPVILVVFVLRSFAFEPFKIPSGSMIPTLHIGDLILVNKFHYGIRLPVLNTRITQGQPVAHGDVVVFRYPPNPKLDYIKRVIGLPGDEVAYLNKQLRINGQAIATSALPDFFDESVMRYFGHASEKLPGKTHALITDADRPAFIAGAADFRMRDQCKYSIEGVVCQVPEGHYFMMGDNRDNSLDSRYWGFVADHHIVGKASVVWMNFGNLSRIGTLD